MSRCIKDVAIKQNTYLSSLQPTLFTSKHFPFQFRILLHFSSLISCGRWLTSAPFICWTMDKTFYSESRSKTNKFNTYVTNGILSDLLRLNNRETHGGTEIHNWCVKKVTCCVMCIENLKCALSVCVCVFCVYIQGVPGGMCQTSGECSLS